jgi:drug/metabolite transporter (DMT)-like permease
MEFNNISWFLVALGAPFVWSLVNHCDKIILSRYFKGGGSGGLMIFVGVIAIPIAVIIGILYPGVFSVSGVDVFYLLLSGILYNAAVYLYLKALETEDTSYIVPFWQLAPMFSYILGVIFLNEYLSADKLFASLIVIIGALILSLNFKKGERISINKSTALIMIFSALFIACTNVFFKKSAIDDLPFVVSMFWNQVGMAIFAIAFFADKTFRTEFLDVIKQNSTKVLGLNIFEQIAEVAGIVINNFAILLAPVALVVLVEYTAQPLFVFIEGVLFTLFIPTLVHEDISPRNLLQKFVAIVVMGVGLYIITR